MRAIKPKFPNKPRAVPRVNDRRGLSGRFDLALITAFNAAADPEHSRPIAMTATL
jgi:transposase